MAAACSRFNFLELEIKQCVARCWTLSLFSFHSRSLSTLPASRRSAERGATLAASSILCDSRPLSLPLPKVCRPINHMGDGNEEKSHDSRAWGISRRSSCLLLYSPQRRQREREKGIIGFCSAAVQGLILNSCKLAWLAEAFTATQGLDAFHQSIQSIQSTQVNQSRSSMHDCSPPIHAHSSAAFWLGPSTALTSKSIAAATHD